jgi:hypothetical protein
VYLAESGTAVSIETAEVDPARSCFFVSVWNRLCVLSCACRHTKGLKPKQNTRASPWSKGQLRWSQRRQRSKYTMEYCAFWPLRARETRGRLTVGGLGAALRDGANHPVTR